MLDIRTQNITPMNHRLEYILKHECVSFDIFDTLVKRYVSLPTDVFDIVELRYNNTHGTSNEKINGFKELRVQAELKARKNIIEEVSIDEIYNFMKFDSAIAEELKKLELKTEYEICIPNKPIVNLFNECIKNGKKVIITSDMYLPEGIVRDILNHCGIIGYARLYLSSSMKKTKKTGTLFRYILDKENLEPCQLVHIGDTLISDFFRPKMIGIHIIMISRTKSKGNDTNYLSLLNNIIDYKCQSKEDYFKYMGYRCLGPLLWGYTHWLIKNFQKEDINKIYFLARDGFIMKKAFDIINKNENLKSYYLEVSRRSLRIPVLWKDPSFVNLLTMLSPSKRISLKSIFDGVGLDINEYVDLVRKYRYDLNSYFYKNTILKEDRLMLLYNELQDEIVSNSKKEFTLMCEYIKQMHVEGRFAIVDIGWSGGMQRFLQKLLGILGIENEILGYYTGVADFYKRNLGDGKLSLHGYLFDFCNNESSVDERSSFVGLYETLFLERKGSVKCYIRNEDECLVAERYDYEYKRNGKLQKEYYIVDKIQSAAIDFINDIEKMEFVKDIPFAPNVLFANLKAVGLSPSRQDLKMLARFSFFDEGETSSLVSTKSFVYYLFSPRSLKSDLLSSRWKIGFLKCLLKIPLPYFKLYTILKNRK